MATQTTPENEKGEVLLRPLYVGYQPMLGLASRLGRKLRVSRIPECTQFIIENACNADYFARGQHHAQMIKEAE